MVNWKDELEEIGHDLDKHIFPIVMNGGFIQPGNSAAIRFSGVEIDDGTSRFKRRSSTGSWKRTKRRQGSAYAPSPYIGANLAETCKADLTETYKAGLIGFEEAYPGAKFWWQPDGFWAIAKSGIFDGLNRSATIVTGMFTLSPFAFQSWAFWEDREWIGPRHTNFPNGSICAFDPLDSTWIPGDPLVVLFDLYTVWLVRHLHLSVFGRWPGAQAVPHPYERFLELRDSELCGCDREPPRPYEECCRADDLQRDRIADAVQFTIHTGGGLRSPPQMIRRFVLAKTDPPPLSDLLMTG